MNQKIFFYFLLPLFLSRCIPFSYYHSCAEPLLSPKRAKAQLNLDYRPFLKVNTDLMIAVNQKIVVKGGFMVGPLVQKGKLASFYFFGDQNKYFFAGLTGEYQEIHASKKRSFYPGASQSIFNYSCKYFSQGIKLGCNLGNDDFHQFAIHIARNETFQYRYQHTSFTQNNNSNQAPMIFNDNETLEMGPGIFYTAELSYAFIQELGPRCYTSIQGAVLFTKNKFRHEYEFEKSSTGKAGLVSKTVFHPMGNFLNFSVGITYFISRTKSKV